jgi:allantoate deiminase
VLGVVLALELVREARERSLPCTVEVIAFSEEEGVRFGVPYLGSLAVAGRFDAALLNLMDSEGISLESAIRAYGLNPAEICDAQVADDAIGFLELHIEQGPVLEAEDLQVAAVTAIVGQTRCEVRFLGQANHAGTNPMGLRRDALVAAAEWITAVEAAGRKTDTLVATVGKVVVEPNAVNVIPGQVRVSLDLRHARDSVRNKAAAELLGLARSIAARRGLRCEVYRLMEQVAVPMDDPLTGLLAESMEAAGFPPRRMSSGAGHDTMVIATRLPTAMLFLRSPGGLSHHPDETVRAEDVAAAIQVGAIFLERLSARAV